MNFPTLPPIAREGEAEMNNPLIALQAKRACEARHRRQTLPLRAEDIDD